MNELIEIHYENDNPTVNGRDLHNALQINAKYSDWFKRMCEYGFTKGRDYETVLKNVIRADGSEMPQKQYDHQISINMAKQLCMIQRSEIGRKFREYFISIEEAWNSPEKIMGSKVLGGLGISSRTSIRNYGKIISVENLLQMVTDFTLKNYGIILSNGSVTIEAQELSNAGKIEGADIEETHIDFSKVGKFSNKKEGSVEAKKGDIYFKKGVTFSNSGRIAAQNLALENVQLSDTSDSGSMNDEGLIRAKDRLLISSNQPLSHIRGIIKASNFTFVNNSRGSIELSSILLGAGIQIDNVAVFRFPHARLENKKDTILGFRTEIFANEFWNLSKLHGLFGLKIHADTELKNGEAELCKYPFFLLSNDWDIRKNAALLSSVKIPNPPVKKRDTVPVDLSPSKMHETAIITADEGLELTSGGLIKNTGTIQARGHLTLNSPQVQHGWAYESTHHESLPELEFDYHFMEPQPSYIRAGRGAEITAAKFLNTFGIIDVVGGLISSNATIFLNYAGNISVQGDAQITAPTFANLIGTVKTERADKRYWTLEFCNTNPASLNVLGGELKIDSPYAINSGSFLYGQEGVWLNGSASNRLVSVFDISSRGLGYTRMYSVNEYNRGQYADKILGMGYTSTGLGAIIRAELNETIRKRVLPASVSSSKKVVIDGYKDLKSDGIVHGASVGIKTGDGTTELGYTGDAILPAISGFAKKIEIQPYISSLAQEEQFELADETGNFLFKSRAGGMKIPFTIIGDGQTDLSKLKLPFSLEVLEVMVLKQIQKSLGTGYLSDMPTFLDAARVAHGLTKGGREAMGFPFLRDYTAEPIKIISEDQATRGLFFKPQKIGDYDVLVPELRLSPESVHAALVNPAGATVAQGCSDANVTIDTDGFLHATASIHADDSIRIKAKRGALFETTTYDAMAITQNVTATTSRSGPFGINSDTEYHKLTEWHQVKVAQEPMLATTTRGDFVIVLPDDKETAEFKGMFADIAGNFEVHGGNCVLSPLEVARVEKCPGLFGGGANRISTMLPVFLKTVLKSNKDFLTDVRVFKNTAGKIEALGDIVINATDRIEFNTETRKFTLAEGMEVDEGTFTTKVSSRKVEDVIFGQPEAKAGGDIKFNSDSVHMTGSYESEGDIEISARLATLESVLGYGTDEFRSRASNMFSNASYSRFATFARVAPTVFRAHGDFIADIIDLYAEHTVQKSCRDERITAGEIDSSPFRARETVVEHSSSSGFNFFVPTSVVAPVCDGNIRQAIDAFWRESSLLSSTCSLLHSRRGADIAANGMSTALSAYASIKTVLDFGAGGFASLFGIGDFGFYHIESSQNTTHEFTVGSTTTASGNIEWRARTGDIKIAHRLAEAGGNQSYTAAGRIEVNPGEDEIRTDSRTTSVSGTFNIFTGGVSLGGSGGPSNSSSVEYLASGFKSQGTNVFRAGKDISIVIPQIEGSRNVFDAMLVCFENKANEREVHSKSYGVTISTNPLEALALTVGANFGIEDSYDTHLNDAYIRGAVDFMHSRVRNQGCVVMNIENAGASYEYVPGHEVHDSTSFAIGLSGLDLTSADGFAYSLGRSLASSATSMGVGMLASEAGLGGFVSTIAASLAGTWVNTEVFPQQRDATHHPVGLGSTGTVSYERDGNGFRAINVDFDRGEFSSVINKIKENIFTEALDKGSSIEETVERIEVLGEWAKEIVASEKAKGKSDKEAVAEVEKNAEVAKEIVKIDQEVRKESLDTEAHEVSSQPNQVGMNATSAEIFLQSLTRSTLQETSHEKAMRTYLIMKMLEYSAQPTQENLSKLNKTINVAKRTAVRVLDGIFSVFLPQVADALPIAAAPVVEIALVRLAVWMSENPQFIPNAMSTISGIWNLGQILEKKGHDKGTKKSVKPTEQMSSTGGAPNLEPEEPKDKKDWHKLSRAERLEIQKDFVERKVKVESWEKPEHKIGGRPAYKDTRNNGIYYTKDGRHGDIEVWKVSGKRAEHQGSMEPITGRIYRGANHNPEPFE